LTQCDCDEKLGLGTTMSMGGGTEKHYNIFAAVRGKDYRGESTKQSNSMAHRSIRKKEGVGWNATQ